MFSKGIYPAEYERIDVEEKPLGEVFRDLDGFTHEALDDDTPSWILSSVICPPLRFEGVRVRGVLLTMAAEYLLERFPIVGELFHVVASSQWANFAWSRRADALCSQYDNPIRNEWFRWRYPARKDQLLLPFEEADWANECHFVPKPGARKRDLLCTSRQIRLKNLPFLAKALKVYRRKYGAIRMTLAAGVDTDWRALSGEPRTVMRAVERALGNIHEYIDLVDFVHPTRMPERYAGHKLLLMGSLIEGKNRSLHEAMLCDTPVICCSAFNRFTRGPVEVFPQGAGMLAPFEAEGFADVVYAALHNLDTFAPRSAYLNGFSGRMHTFDRCLSTLREYTCIPGIMDGRPRNNPWLKAACLENYGCELSRFIYEFNPCVEATGLEHHANVIEFYAGAWRRSSGVSRLVSHV